MSQTLFVGIDLGTSGCRAIAINGDGQPVAQATTSIPAPIRDGKRVEQDASIWWQAVQETIHGLLAQVQVESIKGIAVDGTSGTLLLVDDKGEPLAPALMYNDGRSQAEALRIDKVAPQQSAAHGATSALAKLLHLQSGPEVHYALHQADWISGKLSGQWGSSDENNCLKLGFDAINNGWPAWLEQLGVNQTILPKVYQPGTAVATISPKIAQQFKLSRATQIIAGTTDSTAAFIATGANQVGEAVTSLGSTLVMKVISDRPIFSPRHGVYSQPLAGRWLVGGSSNSGGAVLQHYFSQQQLTEMTAQLKPDHATGLNYYPLINPGERFPIADSRKPPCLSPRPEDDVVFFQAMLESMARIEQQGYQLLAELGAPYPSNVRSAGGGSANPAWTKIRQTLLGIPMLEAQHQQAAYGSALLARQGYLDKPGI